MTFRLWRCFFLLTIASLVVNCPCMKQRTNCFKLCLNFKREEIHYFENNVYSKYIRVFAAFDRWTLVHRTLGLNTYILIDKDILDIINIDERIFQNVDINNILYQ